MSTHTYISNTWTYFNEIYQNYSLSGPHDTEDILILELEAHVFEGQSTENFAGGGIAIVGSPSKTI